MRSSVVVIRSASFGAQKRRKYAKNVGVNMSGVPTLYVSDHKQQNYRSLKLPAIFSIVA